MQARVSPEEESWRTKNQDLIAFTELTEFIEPKNTEEET